jgi:large subunit ribosomal protein L17
MRHQRSGRKLGRDSAHRKALYSNLAGALIEHGRIKTTITKAKAVRPIAEQMITLGRRGDLHARRQAVAFLRSKDVVHKLFAEVGPAFAARPGGYTRIVRIGPRQGDASEMAYLELVDTPLVFKSGARSDEHSATTVDADPPELVEPSSQADEGEPESDEAPPDKEASAEAETPGEAETPAQGDPVAEAAADVSAGADVQELADASASNEPV